MRFRLVSLLGLVVCAVCPLLFASDLRITIPARSQFTPVQRLNREGVDAILHQKYEKAEGLFYKAYLYDPADPFTLTNLGYVSELQGELERAEKFYKLAEEQGCNAVIDRTSAKQLKGKPMMYALDTLKNAPMRVNRMNVLGIELLSQDRGFEAESLLKQALALDPQNPFTLNNLGVAEEATGDFDDALKYYDAAAATHSMEPIIVTLKRSARGKPVSEIAGDSAQDLRKRMRKMDLSRAHATMLAMRGVAEVNRNDWEAAKQDFLKSYSIDPNSAFTLNNLGYVSEREGDPETAQFFYGKAQKADNADARVGLATKSLAKGEHLAALADNSDQKVGNELNAYTQSRREQPGAVELVPRYGSEPKTSPGSPSNKKPLSDSEQQQPQ